MNFRRILELQAYHGSTKAFKKLSTDKMGSGQGSQEYGWGVYLTGSLDIADYYATNGGKPVGIIVDGKIYLGNDQRGIIGYKNLDRGTLVRNLQIVIEDHDPKKPGSMLAGLKNTQKLISKELKRQGRNERLVELLWFTRRIKDPDSLALYYGKPTKYQVDVPLDPDTELIDYHKPMGQQPPAVKKNLQKLCKDQLERLPDYRDAKARQAKTIIEKEKAYYQEKLDKYKSWLCFDAGKSIADFQESYYSVGMSPEQLSKLLLSYGIKGLVYNSGEIHQMNQGFKNYVLFDTEGITQKKI